MGVMARWRNMQWVVNTRRLSPLKSLSTSKTLKKETNEDRDGSNPSNVKGFQPQPLTCEYPTDKIVGGDPLQDLETWRQQIGKSGPFYLAGRRFGPTRLQLQEVGFADTELDSYGAITRATISLSFVQDGSGGPTASGNSNAPGISSGSKVASALNVGPSQAAIKQKVGG